MRVLMDGYWWRSGPPSGVNVVRSIVDTWALRHPEDRLTLLVRKRDLTEALAYAGTRTPAVSIRAYPGHYRVHALAALLPPHPRGYDAVVSQTFSPMRGGRCRAALVHDAMFADHPEWFSRMERTYFTAIRPSLRRAHVVLTTSDTETDRISRVWPEVADKCVPIGLAAPIDLTRADSVRPPLPFPRGTPFILAVGRLNIRKNLGRLVLAFEEVSQRYPGHLVVVGESERHSLAFTPSGGAPRTHFVGSIPDEHLRWLYENADLMVFPSLDEGYGLPLVEAAVNGAPSVASDIPVFRELDLAEGYFDPLSVPSVAQTIAAALEAKTQTRSGSLDTWDSCVGRIRDAILDQLSAS